MSLKILQLIIGVIFIIVILLQSRGTGLSGVFGGSGTAIHRSKRGMEKWLFYLTIVLGLCLLALTLISLAS